jgi:hypothetical protein
LPLPVSVLFPARMLGRPGLADLMFNTIRTEYTLHHLVFAPVVLPLQRLKIGQLITAALRNRHDVIDLPAISAAVVPVIGTDNGPTPRIDAKSFVDAHGSCLLPYCLDYFRAEWLARYIRVRLALHGETN